MRSQTQIYRSNDEAERMAHQQLAYYRELAQERGISLIQVQSDLLLHLSEWQQASPEDEQRPVGLVLLMEGADPIRTPGEAEQWWLDGIRMIGLSWNTGSHYAGGNVTGSPLPSWQRIAGLDATSGHGLGHLPSVQRELLADA